MLFVSDAEPNRSTVSVSRIALSAGIEMDMVGSCVSSVNDTLASSEMLPAASSASAKTS